MSAVLQRRSYCLLHKDTNRRRSIIMEEQYSAMCPVQLRKTRQIVRDETGRCQILAFTVYGFQS